MPLYFFDVRNDGQHLHDEEGTDLANDRVAESEAVALLQDLAKSLIIKDGHGGVQTSVRTTEGHTIFKASLSLVMDWPEPTI